MKPIDEYISKLPSDYQHMVIHLIEVIKRELPEAEVLYKWGIPFMYYKQKPFCYVSPNLKSKYVDLGFVKGYLLLRNQEVLNGSNRKLVKSLRFTCLEAIDNALIIDVLNEAKSLY